MTRIYVHFNFSFMFAWCVLGNLGALLAGKTPIRHMSRGCLFWPEQMLFNLVQVAALLFVCPCERAEGPRNTRSIPICIPM